MKKIYHSYARSDQCPIYISSFSEITTKRSHHLLFLNDGFPKLYLQSSTTWPLVLFTYSDSMLVAPRRVAIICIAQKPISLVVARMSQHFLGLSEVTSKPSSCKGDNSNCSRQLKTRNLIIIDFLLRLFIFFLCQGSIFFLC